MRLEYLTAGESHGPQLTAIIRGIPSGLAVTPEDINGELARRQWGYGRGARMKIEKDEVLIRGGIRKGLTMGSPVALVVENRDYQNWANQMAPEPGELNEYKVITKPRPGHADLPGVLKFNHRDARNILERSSARETAARVAVGAVCKALLREFGIAIHSHVVKLCGVSVDTTGLTHEAIRRAAEASELRVASPEVEQPMRDMIDRAKAEGDTLGGVVEIVALGVPIGLGSSMNWDEKLDGRLAHGMMSCQAIKGVSIGMGFGVADLPGSKVHDAIAYGPPGDAAGQPLQVSGRGPTGGFRHVTNNAGGIEGGMSNGEPIVVRAAMKPIATLMKPLMSVDLKTKEPFDAARERSDVCAVPAAGVVCEAIMATILAQAFLEKFGGDSVAEVRRNYESYIAYLREY